MILYLTAATNNRACTVLNAFSKATELYGIPSRVRMDHGGENEYVIAFMENHHNDNGKSCIRGRSVHNQRIERLWVDVFRGVSNVFHNLFLMMEDIQILDINDDFQMFALHFTFLPRIQSKLNEFCAQYNNHNLRTENNRTPQQLFVLGTLANFNSEHRGIAGIHNVSHINNTQLDVGKDDSIQNMTKSEGDNDDTPSNNRVVVPDVRCPLSNRHFSELQAQIDVNNVDDPLGILTYKEVLQFIAECR